MVDSNHGVCAIEEYDVDRESHEEHVHPHERTKPPGDEQHPLVGLEMVTTEEAAAPSRHPAGILEAGAQDGGAGQVSRAQQLSHGDANL